MNTTIISPIQRLSKISPNELSQLKEWLRHVQPFMIKSVSTYAQGRRELHLRHSVKLADKDAKKLGDEVVKVPDSVMKKYKSELIETIGEKLLPGFHEGLVLHYPKGTLIKPHRDSRAYEKGAASINIIGNANFFISHNQDASNMESIQLTEGDCIQFDNKQPHAIAKVEQDRWCVCFFYLKQEFLPKPSEQLGLFAAPITNHQSSILNIKPGDRILYGYQNQWEEGTLIEFWNPRHPNVQTYTPNFSFFTVNVKGRIKKGYGLQQIKATN